MRSKSPESFHNGSSGNGGQQTRGTARRPQPEPDEAEQPRDGPKLLGRRHRNILDVLARMSRRDGLVLDTFDVEVVGRRDGGPAHDQGGFVRRRYVTMPTPSTPARPGPAPPARRRRSTPHTGGGAPKIPDSPRDGNRTGQLTRHFRSSLPVRARRLRSTTLRPADEPHSV